MNEFAGNVLGTNDHWCVTASSGRNFIPQERGFSKEGIRWISMILDATSVMAFLVMVVVLSL